MVIRILVLFLILNLCGCSTWLRYNYQEAISRLPAESKILFIDNDCIIFWLDGQTFLADYSGKGEILSIKKYDFESRNQKIKQQ